MAHVFRASDLKEARHSVTAERKLHLCAEPLAPVRTPALTRSGEVDKVYGGRKVGSKEAEKKRD